MNRANLRAYTRRILAEQTAADSFWSDADLDDFINRAYEEVVSRGELLQCTSLASSMAGQQEYALPQDTLRVIRVFYNKKTLTYASLQALDLADPDWPTKVCAPGETPRNWTVRGQLFHLYPAPAESLTDGIKLWCIQCPPPLDSEDDKPEIPECYHEAICWGAATRALEADRTSPESARAIQRLLARFEVALAHAKAQHLRKAPDILVLKDIRDFYTTPSGWRD